MGGLVDGYVPGIGDNVAIIDDVLTTGGSIRKMYAVIESTGAKIVGLYAVVKRTEVTAEVLINGLRVNYLLAPNQLL